MGPRSPYAAVHWPTEISGPESIGSGEEEMPEPDWSETSCSSEMAGEKGCAVASVNFYVRESQDREFSRTREWDGLE